MRFIDFRIHAFLLLRQGTTEMFVGRRCGPLRCKRSDLCRGEIDRFILQIDKLSDWYAP